MVIKSASTHDAGVYACVAKNEAGECKVQATIKVQPSKTKVQSSPNTPAFTKELKKQYSVEEGGEIVLDVEFTGKPKPQVKWEKNGSNIISIKRVKIQTDDGVSTLTIKGFRKSDLGHYTCTISSFRGSETCSSTINFGTEETPDIQIEAPTSPEPTSKPSIRPAELDDADNADDEVAAIAGGSNSVSSSELGMKLLEIKELHPGLNREVTRHKFPGATGIDVVVMPATPRDSPISGAQPEIKEKPTDLDLNVGETALFELVLADSQGVNVSWSKNGQILFGSGKTRIWNKDNSFFLEISKVDVEDEDLYECRVRNEYGEVMCDVQLLVNDEDDSEEEEEEEIIPAKFNKKLNKEYQVVEGDGLTLEVKTEGTNVTVSWLYEGQKLLPSEFMKFETKRDMHRLIIPETVLDDEGIYSCTVSNEKGKDECEAEVYVDEAAGGQAPASVGGGKKPEILRSLQDKEAFEDDEIRFDVEITGCDNVQWFLNDKEVRRNKRFDLISKDDRYSLIIKNVEVEDDGQIKVKASNKAGSTEVTCDLLVEADNEDEETSEKEKEEKETKKAEQPPKFITTFNDQQITQGSTHHIHVQLNTSDTKVTWLCGDEPITAEKFSHMTVVSDDVHHSLIINEVKLLDTSQYTCLATNDYGECRCSADLLVLPAGLSPSEGDEGKSEEDQSLQLALYITTEDYKPVNSDFIPLNKDDLVEVLDSSKEEWLVRKVGDASVIGFVEPRVLKKTGDEPTKSAESAEIDDGDVSLATILDPNVLAMIKAEKELLEKEKEESLEKEKEEPGEVADKEKHKVESIEVEKRPQYIAIGNFEPKTEEELLLTEGTLVELLEGSPNEEYWVVRVLKTGDEGLVLSTYLQLLDDTVEEDKEKSKSLEHRAKVVKELLKTEKTYIEQLNAAIQSHMVEAERPDSPMRAKRTTVFANLKEIHEFHSTIFMDSLESALKDGTDIAQAFLNSSDQLETMYVHYCNSRPAADEVLDTKEMIEYWDEFQHATDDPHPLRAYLITPVQRITRYQLLLKEILKYTTRAGEESTSIENALSKISYIIRHANDKMHINRIVGYECDIPLQQAGKLLRMETVLCWDGMKAKGKGKERYLFLLEKVLIGAKRTEASVKAKDDFTYNVKFVLKISDVGQTEFVENFPTRWVIWAGKSAASATVQYTLEAKSELDKDSWVREIREMLARQLADLKNNQGKTYEKPPQVVSPTLEIQSNQLFPAVTENVSENKNSVSRIVDDLTEIEEQYIASEYLHLTLSTEEREKLVPGELYRLTADAKSRDTTGSIFKSGDLVSLIRAGTTLFLVEPAGSDDPFKQTWVPGSYLAPLIQDIPGKDEKCEDPPVFINDLVPVISQSGVNVKFECQVVNSTSVEWFYDDMMITDAEGTEIFFNKETGVTSLTIENVCVEDEGDYTVRGINDAGVASRTAKLQVSDPPVITAPCEPLSVPQYENANFKCMFNAYPAPQVMWYCNGEVIEDAGKFIIETKSTVSILDIAEVDLKDSGEYKCVVVNDCGQAECTASLIVEQTDELEVPAPPGLPAATKVTDKSVTLSWPVSPSSDVTHYVIELRHFEDDANAWKIGADKVESTTCVLDDLKYGDEIVFRVFAYNQTVASEPSPVSEKVLVEAPRKKKTNKKRSEDTLSTKSPDDKQGGRLSPFLQRKGFKRAESSSDEDGSGGERGRLSPARGLLFTSSRKSRARSKSPMNKKHSAASPTSPDGKGAPYFTRQLENCFVGEGGAAKFICRCQGNPEPEVTWFKEKERLTESKQFSILFDADENCVLIITQSNHDTAGSYTCVASNDFGTSKSSAMLYVEGLQTEYDTETEEEVSDPEPQPDREIITVKKENVENHYVLKEELGRGKFGVVTKCQCKNTSIEYAAKFIKCRPTERKNVLNEIDIMNSLNHKRLINLIAAFEASRQIVLVLELVTGGELFEKLTEEEYISEKDVTFYMKQVLQGIQHMHEREILHLDLKPENIMLVNPHSTQIKLIDFGLARRYKKGDALKVLFGTPEFMAPEVINYDQVTTATDMWSIGVITYVLLSGLSPFAGDNDSETLTNVTSGEWDFDDPVFEDISDEAKDFITELLVMKARDRATVKDCLEHPWFMFKKFKKKIRTDRLKAFTARRKWKKTITAVRSTNFLTRLLTGIKASQAGGTAPVQSTPTTPTDDKGESTITSGSSSTGPAWKKAENVEEADAPDFEDKLGDLKIRRGDVAHFKASFMEVEDEKDIPVVTWKKEGKFLNESKHIHMTVIGNIMHMKILNSHIGDTGRYTLRLENQHGAAECSAHLIVTDAPSPPAAPTITQVLATSALVQWRPPFDGNEPIKSYRLQYRKLGDQEWSVFSDSIVQTITVVEDLEPDSSYRFRVSATNANGSSEMGEQTDLVKTPAENETNKRESIDAPGARRLSRSLSITVPTHKIRSRAYGYEVKLKEENPENSYNFKEEIGRGKFAVVKNIGSKHTGETYAAKMVKYDEDTVEVTKKEFDIWKDLDHPNLPLLHEAFFVRKYLILVCDLVNGEDVLSYLSSLTTPTEDDVASVIKQLLEVLDYLHQMDVVHLDIKPSNLMMLGSMLKLIDFGSARRIKTQGGEVGEMVGTAEFMAPEMISFDPVNSCTDMWSVGVVVYSLLSGISPFSTDDEDETMNLISSVDYRFDPHIFDSISEEAKTFIQNLLVRIPERRPSASVCLVDPWLSDEFESARLASPLQHENLLELSDYLEDQEQMENVRASLVIRTFLQSPYDSPAESESESDSGEEEAWLLYVQRCVVPVTSYGRDVTSRWMMRLPRLS